MNGKRVDQKAEPHEAFEETEGTAQITMSLNIPHWAGAAL